MSPQQTMPMLPDQHVEDNAVVSKAQRTRRFVTSFTFALFAIMAFFALNIGPARVPRSHAGHSS